jgi:hypothetical protein
MQHFALSVPVGGTLTRLGRRGETVGGLASAEILGQRPKRNHLRRHCSWTVQVCAATQVRKFKGPGLVGWKFGVGVGRWSVVARISWLARPPFYRPPG